MDIGKRTNDAINKASRDVQSLFDSKSIDELSYTKLMVSLAFEFTENMEHDQALNLLLKCTPLYYQDYIVPQMKEDNLFRDCVIRMTYNLIRAGYIAFEKDPLELITPSARA